MAVATKRQTCGVILTRGKRKGEPCGEAVIPDAIPLTCRRHQLAGPSGQCGQIKREAFLSHYRESGNVRRSCEAAGIGRSTYHEWLNADPTLVAEMLDAREDAIDALEGSLRDQAIDEGNVTAAIFLLKSLRPERYRETLNANLRVDTGLPEPTELPEDDRIGHLMKSMQTYQQRAIEATSRDSTGPVVDPS